MAFCQELMRKVETKSLADEILRFGSVLVEAKLLCVADVKKAVMPYLPFNKKLIQFSRPGWSVSYSTDLGKPWLGLIRWTKSLELRRILDCSLFLVIRITCSFDFEAEAFRAVE